MKAKINFGKAGQEIFSLVNANLGWCWMNDKRNALLSLGGCGSIKASRSEAIKSALSMYKGRLEVIDECVSCDHPTTGDYCSYACAEQFSY